MYCSCERGSPSYRRVLRDAGTHLLWTVWQKETVHAHTEDQPGVARGEQVIDWDVDLSLYFQWMKQNLNSSRCPVAARSVWTHSCQTVVRAMNLLGDRKLREDLTEVSRTWGGRACGVGGAEAESTA